jgi:flagellar motor switch protein FliN/FliY
MNAAQAVARQPVGEQKREPAPPERSANLKRILGLSVPVTVTLAEREMSVESILAIRVGTILEFDVSFDSELQLCVANHPIGTGTAVKSGENFGLRINRIATVQDRIESLGHA